MKVKGRYNEECKRKALSERANDVITWVGEIHKSETN